MNLNEMSLADTDDTEILFLRIRNWRTQELLATDWTQAADSTADRAAWAIYRQALRDLPAQNKDPKKIVFPTRPEA
jgi:hypothetical protein